jgi:deoxyribodipyrimidine photo-lyase
MNAADPPASMHDVTAAVATREAALAALAAFIPQAGQAYARERNHDPGPGQPGAVSRLSPWIRHRLVSEAEVAAAVLTRHTAEAAEKFLQEVCWRSYWKGWLEQRPAVWSRYQAQVAHDLARVNADPDLQRRWQAALRGETGIAGYDDWAQELLATGQLHNHARMWFASIWIFTLDLPWALGADWFLRQLLDGDPASNTLSWRWVAGLHTPGKTYLARADNILRYSGRRFAIAASRLAATAVPRRDSQPLPPPLGVPSAGIPAPGLRTGVLLTEDDTTPETWLAVDTEALVAVAGLTASAWRSPLPVSPAVAAFSAQAVADGLARAAGHWAVETAWLTATADGGGRCDGGDTDVDAVTADATALRDWIRRHGLQQLLIPGVPCGPARDRVGRLLAEAGCLDDPALRLCRPRRRWDSLCWPHARAGFFGFWKGLPPWSTLLG